MALVEVGIFDSFRSRSFYVSSLAAGVGSCVAAFFLRELPMHAIGSGVIAALFFLCLGLHHACPRLRMRIRHIVAGLTLPGILNIFFIVPEFDPLILVLPMSLLIMIWLMFPLRMAVLWSAATVVGTTATVWAISAGLTLGIESRLSIPQMNDYLHWIGIPVIGLTVSLTMYFNSTLEKFLTLREQENRAYRDGGVHLCDVLGHYRKGDYVDRAQESFAVPHLGEIAQGINALGDEIQRSTVSISFLEDLISLARIHFVFLTERAQIIGLGVELSKRLSMPSVLPMIEFTGIIAHEVEVFQRVFASVVRDGESATLNFDLLGNGPDDVLRCSLSLLPFRKKVHNTDCAALCIVREMAGAAAGGNEILLHDSIENAKLNAIGTLIAGVAHEINNPLAIAVASTELLRSECKSAESEATNKRFSQLTHAHERIGKLIKQLNVFSRSDSRSSRCSINFTTIVESQIEFLRTRLQQVQADFDIEPDVYILAQDFLVESIVSNLLKNALDALDETTGEKRLSVFLGKRDKAVVLEVKDSGIGIPLEIIDKIFDPFFTTKPVGRGTGLGLPIVREIVRRLGGEIAAHSRLGVGTKFVVKLPLESERPETPSNTSS